MCALRQEFRIDEFVKMVHPRDGHPKLFAMLDAYLDESGVHDQAKICVIAGYFGGSGQWRRFEKDWRALLAAFDVPMEKFRAKDLFPNPCGFFHGWNRTRHTNFLNAVASTIAAQPKINPVGFGIVVQDFFTYSENVRRFFTGANMRHGKPTSSGCPNKPYFVPFQKCLIQVCGYAPRGGKAHFFFGLDRPFASYATELFALIKVSDLQLGDLSAWKQQIGDPSFPSAKETPQLQAADFLVHLTYQHMVSTIDVLGRVNVPPLLATCISNIRAHDDFQIINKEVLDASLIQSSELSRIMREISEET